MITPCDLIGKLMQTNRTHLKMSKYAHTSSTVTHACECIHSYDTYLYAFYSQTNEIEFYFSFLFVFMHGKYEISTAISKYAFVMDTPYSNAFFRLSNAHTFWPINDNSERNFRS